MRPHDDFPVLADSSLPCTFHSWFNMALWRLLALARLGMSTEGPIGPLPEAHARIFASGTEIIGLRRLFEASIVPAFIA
jgi:hypothetical protein